MDEQKKLSDIEEAAAALIANSEDENPAYKSNKQTKIGRHRKRKTTKRYSRNTKLKTSYFLR